MRRSSVLSDQEDDLSVVLRFTRNWLQYGVLGFTIACIMIGALEGVFGR